MANDSSDIQPLSPQEPSPEHGERTLAAIMFTDIKDFSKKMQKNEVATMRMLKAHNDLMTAAVLSNKGRVIKTIGDAFLVSFTSVIAATKCAIEAQQQFLVYNRDKSADEQITVRIGVHLGDVFTHDNDVFGDGVNIASRIQSMAEPGGVNISGSVYEQIKNKLDVHVINLGVPQLKNIKEPIKVYQVIIVPQDKVRGGFATKVFIAKTILKRKRTKQLIGIASGAVIILAGLFYYYLQMQAIPDSEKTLAILPIKTIGDQEYNYLSDGITQAVTLNLSNLPPLLVISKTSSYNYKESKLPNSTIAKQLGARFIMAGDQQLTTERISLRMRLYDSKRYKQVWEQTYDYLREDIFQLEKLISKDIADHFSVESQKIMQYASTISPEAYENYLRGLFYATKIADKNNNALSIRYFSDAISTDSLFAKARIQLAHAQALQYFWGFETGGKLLSDAELNCKIVLDKDSLNADAYSILGIVTQLSGHHQEAVKFFQRALSIDEYNIIALTQIALVFLLDLHDPLKAVSFLKKLQEIEPNNSILWDNLGVGYAQTKNYPEAIRSFRRSISINPIDDSPWINLGYVYEKIGNYDSAIQSYKNAIKLNQVNTLGYSNLVNLLIANGKYGEAESIVTMGLSVLPNEIELTYTKALTLEYQNRKNDAKIIYNEGRLLLENIIQKNPLVADNYAWMGLFNARMGRTDKATEAVKKAVRTDSTDNVILIKVARVFSILGEKKELLYWFQKAKSMNVEYDAAYINSIPDFKYFLNDPDLMLIAKLE